MRNSLFLSIFLITFFTTSIFCQKNNNTFANANEHPDFENVEAAILDYVEGLYLVDSTRIEKSVHPELHKRGYWFDKKNNQYRDNLDMTYGELRHLATQWNKSGKAVKEDSPKEIVIYEITDKTATAKLTAEWGMDYFHLAKLDGKWMIMNVLWQSIRE